MAAFILGNGTIGKVYHGENNLGSLLETLGEGRPWNWEDGEIHAYLYC